MHNPAPFRWSSYNVIHYHTQDGNWVNTLIESVGYFGTKLFSEDSSTFFPITKIAGFLEDLAYALSAATGDESQGLFLDRSWINTYPWCYQA